jgi:cob(I)alamin adenosyltransferase
MKVYTGSGDRGKTSLFSGERVPKHHRRIEAYGEVDELNAAIGGITAALSDEHTRQIADLQQVQSDLFRIGAWLSTSPSSPQMEAFEKLSSARTTWLEGKIDAMSEDLPPLHNFILPGGHPSAAWAHVARTVCRRCERQILRMDEETAGGEHECQYRIIQQYLNRLSDYFFVLARHCNRIHGVADVTWQG